MFLPRVESSGGVKDRSENGRHRKTKITILSDEEERAEGEEVGEARVAKKGWAM